MRRLTNLRSAWLCERNISLGTRTRVPPMSILARFSEKVADLPRRSRWICVHAYGVELVKNPGVILRGSDKDGDHLSRISFGAKGIVDFVSLSFRFARLGRQDDDHGVTIIERPPYRQRPIVAGEKREKICPYNVSFGS